MPLSPPVIYWCAYAIDYQFIDYELDLGMNYYRVVQFDYSGEFDYSKVISVNIESYMLENKETDLYPNPTEGTFVLTLKNKESKITVVNSLGEKISYNLLDIEEGVQVTLNFAEQGVYMVYVERGTVVQELKVLVY